MEPMLREITCQDHTTSAWQSWDWNEVFVFPKLMPTIFKNLDGKHCTKYLAYINSLILITHGEVEIFIVLISQMKKLTR